MSTDLSPQSEQYLTEIVERGVFPDRAHALERAVDLLRQREELVRQVNRGIEQCERGELVPFDVDDIKARGRRRLQERVKEA